MTGKELILYILENNLENEPVCKDGKFVGFITAMEAAEQMEVGLATVYTWINQGRLDHIMVGGIVYIPANYTPPTTKKNEKFVVVAGVKHYIYK
jgi:excisionase family DNA binding protein